MAKKNLEIDPNTGLPVGLDPSPERLSAVKEWRDLFPSLMVKKAGTRAMQSSIDYFITYGRNLTDDCCEAEILVSAADGGTPLYDRRSYYGRRRNFGRRVGVTVKIQRAPTDIEDDWHNASFSCTCPEGRRGMRCVHEAAVLLHWEQESGGSFLVYESNYHYQLRQELLSYARAAQNRKEMMQRFGSTPVDALSYFHLPSKQDGLVFFDMEKILSEYKTTPFYMERAKTVRTNLGQNSYFRDRIELKQSSDGSFFITFSLLYTEPPFQCHVTGLIQPAALEDMNAEITSSASLLSLSSGRNAPASFTLDSSVPEDYSEHILNEYALDALQLVAEFIEKQDSLGNTDDTARTFFRSLENNTQAAQKVQQLPPEPRKKVLALEPRITIEDGEARLGFKVGKMSGRLFVLRNISQFVSAWQQEKSYDLSKKESLDFSKIDFADKDMELLQFLVRRVGETRDVNTQLQEKAGPWYRAASLKEISSFMELHGSLLDSFYDAAKGRTCEYQDKNSGIKGALAKIDHIKMRFKLQIDRFADARGTFAGVTVSGNVPVLIEGSSHHYTLNKEALSRISDDEMQLLAPFRKVATPSGYFRFQVGLDKLQEFYYRVLPNLLLNPCVDLDDRCEEEAKNILPPEPDFTFWLDLKEDCLSCRCTVDYAARRFALLPQTDSGGMIFRSGKISLLDIESNHAVSGKGIQRFTEQEKRVAGLLAEYFPMADRTTGQYEARMTNDALYSFLLNGISALSNYGTVQGTDAFRKQSIRPVPQITVGVSVSSNLMDLSVTSKDLSEDELMDVLQSYKVRRRYHRLKSGDFIDLSDAEKLQEFEELLAELQLAPTDVIRQKAHLPLYRALYLDRLLEEHDELVSSRDRTFRALAKNFRTINDSDYEPPESLADTLRPYQTYGFKWLKTLRSAGFGGILADEMGLGKTLEMISLLLSDKEEQGRTGSLIVCPASLVYNWQEEIRRFAPSLTCCPLAGTKSARKKAMEQNYDVYVTSYDLLRRDIALFGDHTYHICVLDEAQNIKNAKAAVTKAVKSIHCAYRFALTGTPIENRLSELWSIFDYLMPGFLYSQQEFLRKYETPIAKEKDEAVTQQLRRMTSPFILRRLKEDVLKDLPGKMEEVRYARVDGQQQKLYDAQVLRMKGMLSESTGSGEDKIRIFAELTRIRQICCDPSLLFDNYDEMSAKRELCMETIRSAIDGGHRILLFSQFTSMLNILKNDLDAEGISFYEITGSTPKEKRISLVNSFNEGDTPVFLISLKAGGTGLNLTGADVVIHYDPWWNLAAQNQATDRAHRIGQTRQVTVYKLILKDTIEEKILDLQNAKKDLAESILEGESSSIMRMSGEELMQLLS